MKQYCCSLQDTSAVNNLDTVLQALSYATLPNYMYRNILTAYNKAKCAQHELATSDIQCTCYYNYVLSMMYKQHSSP